MLGQINLATPSPVPRRPGPDIPSSSNNDRHVTGLIPSETGEITATQLQPVRATESRPAAFYRVWTEHAQNPFARNSGGTVRIVRRNPAPQGQQASNVGAPTGIYRRGPVPVWTDQLTEDL